MANRANRRPALTGHLFEAGSDSDLLMMPIPLRKEVLLMLVPRPCVMHGGRDITGIIGESSSSGCGNLAQKLLAGDGAMRL